MAAASAAETVLNTFCSVVGPVCKRARINYLQKATKN